MKKYLAIAVIALSGFTAQAQTNVTAVGNERLLSESRRLISDKEYSAALLSLKNLDKQKLDRRERQESDYLYATATFYVNPLEGRALMLQYLEDYPESAKRDILAAYIAESYYYSKNFELAHKWFTGADLERLSPEEREQALLYFALSAQEIGESDFALHILKVMKMTSKRHKNDAIFHLAAIDYYNNQLDAAYEGFKSIELDDVYYLEVPYYLAGIYLKRQEYVRAEKLARLFLEHNSDIKQGIPMRHILGGALYGQQRYKEAIPILNEYFSLCEEPQRIAYYHLAMSLFATGQLQEAIPLFDKCTDKSDEIAQNAYLHQGIIQLKLKDITKARLAFEQASTMNFNRNIREEALYNYALCIHQTRYSPFAESVKVFERFLNEYPSSPHAVQVSKYLVEVYMNTRNYDVALQSINKIKNPSSEILGAKQNILYRLGVQAFIDNNLPQAIEYMSNSISYSRYNRDTHSDALYWRGEARYRTEDYRAAAQDYRAVLALSSRNSTEALYSLAYTQFQTENYSDALDTFGRFLQSATTGDNTKRADAYNRIGDCNFYNRNYTAAAQFFLKAAETAPRQADYALFHAAISQGLLRDYAGKVETLSRLISRSPNSNFIEQAYYEMGRAYVAQEKNNEAVKVFNDLVKQYPQSSLARRAATEIAMIYNQEGNHTKAIAAYKQIIRDYPHSQEAQVAAQDLKNIYIELGRIDDYSAFAEATPGVKNIESSERDTLTYAAAERVYSRQKYSEAREAFKRYLQEYPNGSFVLDSHYYLGLIYYNQKAPNDALAHFKKVIAFPDNKYSEEAMAISSELYYQEKNYQKALGLFKQLAAKTDNEIRRRTCRMNIMRCHYILGDHSGVIESATTLLADGNLSPEWERETHYTRAKSFIASEQSEKAVPDLSMLGKDTRSKQGAEAKYLLAQHYYDKKDYKKCEAEILEYIEMGTNHSYWMARSFILLTDLYMAQNRNLEAKQYLLTLQNNYEGEDDIAQMIKERLDKLNNSDNE